jgi:hypothetical protein
MDILLTATWKEWWVKRGAKKMSFILATMHSILKIKEVFNMYGGQNSSNTLPTIITQMPVKYWDFQVKEIPVHFFCPSLYSSFFSSSRQQNVHADQYLYKNRNNINLKKQKQQEI